MCTHPYTHISCHLLNSCFFTVYFILSPRELVVIVYIFFTRLEDHVILVIVTITELIRFATNFIFRYQYFRKTIQSIMVFCLFHQNILIWKKSKNQRNLFFECLSYLFLLSNIIVLLNKNSNNST